MRTKNLISLYQLFNTVIHTFPIPCQVFWKVFSCYLIVHWTELVYFLRIKCLHVLFACIPWISKYPEECCFYEFNSKQILVKTYTGRTSVLKETDKEKILHIKWLKYKNEMKTCLWSTSCISHTSHKTQRENPLTADLGTWYCQKARISGWHDCQPYWIWGFLQWILGPTPLFPFVSKTSI